MGVSVAIDDRDPSITYTGGWAQASSPNEFDNTSTFTAIAGSTAKLTFTGSSIGVYGSIPAKTPKGVAPVSAYSIDGGPPTLFRANEGGAPQFSQLFFQSPVLPEGTHTLTILYPVAADPFSLDYMLVLQNGPATTSTTSTSTGTGTTTSTTTTSSSTTSTVPTTTSATTTSTSTTPPPLSTITVTSVAQSTTATSGADSTSANATGAAAPTNHTGAIVGGILGGIVVSFFIVFGIIIWRRKQRNKRNSMIASNFWNTDTSTPTPPPKPYTPPRQTTNIPIMTQTTGSSGSYPANPRYPGGYAPAAPQPQAYGGYAPSPAPYSDRGYYAQGADQGYQHGYSDAGYSAGAYLPPSQILSQQAGNDYGRGR